MRQARLLYLYLIGVLVVVYYVVPSVRPVAVGVLGLVSLAGIVYGLWRLRPPRAAAWGLIAGSVALLTAGDVIFTVLAELTPGPAEFPGPPDVLYLIAYVPLAVGLLMLGRPALPSRDWPMVLDLVGLSLAGTLVLWIVLIRPALLSLNLTDTGKLTAIASTVGYVAVLAAVARVMLTWWTNPALRLLGAGVVAFLVADFFYAEALVQGRWDTGTLIDLGFLAFSALAGAAALTPSMRMMESAPNTRHQVGPVRLTIVALALLVAPTALLAEATPGPVRTGVAIAIVSASIAIVMLVRIFLSARDYQRRASREQAVRLASRDLVLATTETDVTVGLSEAFARMRRGDHPGAVRLVYLPPNALPPNAPPGPRFDLAPDGSTGDLVVPLPNDSRDDGIDDQAAVFSGSVAELNELTPALYAVADQAASALQRIRLVGKLRGEERERYFRTLVMTSTDVTLITHHDRVTYATPSARNMFGRDITGDFFPDLVHAVPGDDDPTVWSETAYGEEGHVNRNGETRTVLVRRRDLTRDPTVGGVVTTLQDVTAERDLQRDLAHRATHDPLTGLANAQLFGEELRARDAADDDGSAVLFVDLDDFKAVNDAHGHEVGDHLLAEVARRIEDSINPSHVAARLGGDEFAVLLRDVRLRAARDVAQRIADSLARPAVLDSVVLDCRASVGLAYSDEPTPMNSLLREADIALYTAKAHGKGRWRQYRDGMPVPMRQHADARRRLQEAIDSDQLQVFYQPIVELTSGRPIGFEALLRPDDPRSGISAEELVAIAEDTGMIGPLGEWVLGRALVDLPRLNATGLGPCYVSVNVSARQLRQSDFVDVVRSRIGVTGIDPGLLVLEITENTLIGDDDDRAWRFLDDLRGDGIRIAIDDYGTGFASLSYLRQPGIDIVKLDQSFLTDLTERNQVLIEAVTSVFAKLRLLQIAEGVETDAQRDVLIEAGCPYGQGFLFGPAMPIDEAVAWLRRNGPAAQPDYASRAMT